MKDVFKNAIDKTKKVMSKIIDFLKKKRFSIITFIITLVLCLDIYSCIARPNAREPTTANAMNETINPQDYVYYWSIPMVIPIRTTSGDIPILIDFLLIPSGSIFSPTGVDTYAIQYHKYPDPTVRTMEIAEDLNSIITINRGYGYYGSDAYPINFNWSIIFNVDINTFINSCDLYVFNGSSINFLDAEHNVLAYVFSNVLFFPSSSRYFLTDFIPAYNVDTLINNSYDIGYNEGEDFGYINGLNTSFEDVSPFGAVKSGVDSLLAIELFPSFSIGHILLIAFGMIMIGVLLKVFLGG